jgi:hypothetical protein
VVHKRNLRNGKPAGRQMEVEIVVIVDGESKLRKREKKTDELELE